MKIYSVEVDVCATAYIKADSQEEALAIAERDLANNSIELTDRHQIAGDNICIHGGSYSSLIDNEEDIALSPAMSMNEQIFMFDDIELVEDFEETTDDER